MGTAMSAAARTVLDSTTAVHRPAGLEPFFPQLGRSSLGQARVSADDAQSTANSIIVNTILSVYINRLLSIIPLDRHVFIVARSKLTKAEGIH